MAKSVKEIILPDLGEGIDGAEVSEVSVGVGDTLSSHQSQRVGGVAGYFRGFIQQSTV